MKTKYFKSFSELQDTLSIGHEMNFSLFGFDYYFGAPDGKYVLSRLDGLEVYFDLLDDFYNYEIQGKSIKDLWYEIDIDVIY